MHASSLLCVCVFVPDMIFVGKGSCKLIKELWRQFLACCLCELNELKVYVEGQRGRVPCCRGSLTCQK